VLPWKGELISQVSVDLPKPRPPYRTSEDTVSLIGRLAVHYDDSMIAKVLNQQQRRTATGMSFTPLTWPASASATASPPGRTEQAQIPKET
jgi:hypothetical protein